MKIIGSFIGNVECKRFYMPGIKVFSLCPKCKEEREIDFNDQYLSYPVVNRFQPFYFYCEPCEENWEEEAMLEVSLKGKEMDKPSFCNEECDSCMAIPDCRIVAHKQMRADIEQATFYGKYLQPEHSNIIKNIVDLRKKMPEAVQAQALEYLLSDINWYWNEADLWKEENDNTQGINSEAQ